MEHGNIESVGSIPHITTGEHDLLSTMGSRETHVVHRFLLYMMAHIILCCDIECIAEPLQLEVDDAPGGHPIHFLRAMPSLEQVVQVVLCPCPRF